MVSQSIKSTSVHLSVQTDTNGVQKTVLFPLQRDKIQIHEIKYYPYTQLRYVDTKIDQFQSFDRFQEKNQWTWTGNAQTIHILMNNF